jgi:predicted lipoprotein with Yx(FWY)xxD motif
MTQVKRDQLSARRRPLRGRAAAVGLGGLAVSLIAASCGSSGSTHTATPVVISTTRTATQGTILVSGNTLYTLKASQTPCTAECLTIWPELLLSKGVTAATAGLGVSASKLGTVAGAGGLLQVTYSGQPLYFFSGDTAAGQVNGNVTDTWGTWSDVVTAGLAAASPPPAAGVPTTQTATPTTAITPTTEAPTPTTAATPASAAPTPTTRAPTPTTRPPTPTTRPPTPTTQAPTPTTGGAGF